MEIKHNFKTKSHNLSGLFSGVTRFSTFMRRLEAQSALDPNRYDTQKYLGDGFEFFIELLLKLSPTDNRLGVYDYEPVQENDNGVDGVGVNISLEKSVVQIKYRSDTRTLLTGNRDHLSNLFTDGMLAHNVVSDNDNKKNFRHYVFTTAKSLHFYTDQEMYKGKVKCIGYQDLRNLLDNNLKFWQEANRVISEL